MFPNPVEDLFNVILHDQSAREFTVKLYDATGRIIINETRPVFETNIFNMRHCASGMYELVIIIGDKLVVGKIVKQ